MGDKVRKVASDLKGTGLQHQEVGFSNGALNAPRRR